MSIGKVWALCDTVEAKTGKPTLAYVIKRVLGVTREELRMFERQRRLDVYDATDAKGTRQKAYKRPREREYIGGKEEI